MANFTLQDRNAVEALDHNALALALGGNAIKSGVDVTVNSGSLGSSDTLSVSSGTVLVDGADVSVGSQSVGIDAPNDTPRKDIVYVDSSGSAVVAKGTAEAKDPPSADWRDSFRPVPPSLSDAPGTPLVEVWVPPDATAIDSDNLQSRRIDSVTALSLASGGDYTSADTAETITAQWTFSSGLSLDAGTISAVNDINAANTGRGYLSFISYNGNFTTVGMESAADAGVRIRDEYHDQDVARFHASGSVEFPNGVPTASGSAMLTTADEGSGNGLNADKTDGYDIYVQSSAPSTSDPYIRFEP